MPQSPRTSRPTARRGSARAQKPLLEKPVKPSQRERLMRAMTELSARDGYSEVSINRVSSKAGVSHATFYEQFADKDECFAAAYLDAAERILGQMRNTSRTVKRPAAKTAALGYLLQAIAEDPAAGWLVFVEGLANRAQIPGERERLMDAYEGAVEEYLSGARDNEMLLDVPAISLVGAVRAIVSRRLRVGAADQLPLLLEDLESWIESYATPAGHGRWSTSPAAILPFTPLAGQGVGEMPSATKPTLLPKGRHGLSPAVVARNHRERIMYATAEVLDAKGYAEMTVADIVSAARVARDVFYQHFSDKQDAFLAAQQHNLYENLAVGAIRFFEGPAWPERMWNVLESITSFVAQQPLVANLRYVEPYAAGPEAIQRMDDATLNFTFFIAEGYGQREQARQLPHLASEAIAGATFEKIRNEIAHGRATELPRLLPQLTYVVIAPFTGPAEAVKEIERIASERAPRAAS
jgi:AcrR family transcriptional regulator